MTPTLTAQTAQTPRVRNPRFVGAWSGPDPELDDARSEPGWLGCLHCSPGDLIVEPGMDQPYWLKVLRGQVGLYCNSLREIILGEGEIFGLDRVILDKPVPYSAHAIDHAVVGFYSPDAVPGRAALLDWTRSSLRSVLRQQTQWLERLDSREALPRTFDPNVVVREVSAGTVLLQEDCHGDTFFMLLSSQRGLRVSRDGVEIGRLDRPGEIFGEMACLLGCPRTATVSSIGESVVAEIPGDRLQQMLEDRPDIAWRLLRETVERLERTTRLVDGAAVSAQPLRRVGNSAA